MSAQADPAAAAAANGVDLVDEDDRRGAFAGLRGGPHEWRHGSEPTHRPAYFPRPPGEREVVWHKAFELARVTPDGAAFDLDQSDFDFHLFTDAESGVDTVIYRAGPTGYRLAQVTPDPAWQPATTVPVTVSAPAEPA